MTSPTWTSTAPSGVSFGGAKSGSTTANRWAATYTFSWARSGGYVWIKCSVKFGLGSYGINNGGFQPYPKNCFGHTTTTVCGAFSASNGATVTRYVRYNDTTTTSQSWRMWFYPYTTNVGDGASLDVTLTISGISSWTVAYRSNLTVNGSAVANPANDTKYNNINLTLKGAIGNQVDGGIAASVTITGNANGGTWSGSNGSAGYTTARTTYTHTIWNTAAGGTGTNYNLSATYSTNAALTLYAQWSSSTQAAVGTSYTLPTGTPTKASVTNATIIVTFNPTGGSTSVTTRTAIQSTSYTFQGWWTTPDNSGVQVTTSRRVTAAETVYAHYTASSPAVGVITPNAFQCTRPGHILVGWAESPDATTGITPAGGTYIPSNEITLYAIWVSMGLPIYYKDSSGTIHQVYEVYTKVNDTIYASNVYVKKNNVVYLLE